jgi:hypothetical protein
MKLTSNSRLIQINLDISRTNDLLLLAVYIQTNSQQSIADK